MSARVVIASPCPLDQKRGHKQRSRNRAAIQESSGKPVRRAPHGEGEITRPRRAGRPPAAPTCRRHRHKRAAGRHRSRASCPHGSRCLAPGGSCTTVFATCETRPLLDRSVVVTVGPTVPLSLDRVYAQAAGGAPTQSSALTRREIYRRSRRETSCVGSAGGLPAARRVLARLAGVASRRRIESGRGQARPGPSHTTRHAGPHRAVRSAFPETTVGLGEPFQAHGLVPVGVGQRPLEWPGPCDTPVPLLRRRP